MVTEPFQRTKHALYCENRFHVPKDLTNFVVMDEIMIKFEIIVPPQYVLTINKNFSPTS